MGGRRVAASQGHGPKRRHRGLEEPRLQPTRVIGSDGFVPDDDETTARAWVDIFSNILSIEYSWIQVSLAIDVGAARQSSHRWVLIAACPPSFLFLLTIRFSCLSI
jgi:hypothetical protein